MPLTDTKIRTFKTPDKPVKLADGGGLHLYCSPIGRKYWRMNYALSIKQNCSALASIRASPCKGLGKSAWKPGGSWTKALTPERSKKPPRRRSALKSRRPSGTGDFTEKHRGTVMFRLEKYVFPILGDKHINRIEPRDVLALVRPIDQQGHNETARPSAPDNRPGVPLRPDCRSASATRQTT